VLGRYVRERGPALSLMDAIRKMTLMPAQRLEARVPAMRRKGRLRVGADADITIFDASRVLDRSTYREPTLPPVGIQHVIVNGVSVVANGQAVDGRRTGKGRSGGANSLTTRVAEAALVRLGHRDQHIRYDHDARQRVRGQIGVNLGRGPQALFLEAPRPRFSALLQSRNTTPRRCSDSIELSGVPSATGSPVAGERSSCGSAARWWLNPRGSTPRRVDISPTSASCSPKGVVRA